MNAFIRIGGAVLVSLGALFISREYEKYLDRRISEYRGILSLISHAEGQISGFLAYGSALWRHFEDEALEKCGLLPLLREGNSLLMAFEKSSPKMSLPKQVTKELSKRFEPLGKEYLEGELSNLAAIRERLSELLRAEEEQREKNVKVARALLLGGALCAIILAL